MMKPILAFFLMAFAAPVFAQGYANEYLEKLFRSPNTKTLNALKKGCSREHSIDVEGNGYNANIAHDIAKKPNIFTVKGLVYILDNCADGASAESLDRILGDEVLLSGSRLLIQAIAEEKPAFDLPRLAVQISDEELWACEDESCKADIRVRYQKKRTAIQKVKIPKAWQPIRDKLLSGIPK